jgi:hypothetical protein
MAKPAVYRARRAAGLCGECGEVETGPTRARCAECNEHINKGRRANWAARPFEVRKQHASYMRGYYARNRATYREGDLRRKYGLTLADYDALLAKQGGHCAICPAVIGEVKRNRALFVDHDHATGKVRGLLCGRCNTAIGYLRDHPQYAHALVGYLMRWNLNEG